MSLGSNLVSTGGILEVWYDVLIGGKFSYEKCN
jgi:hypothetical protein